MAMAQKSAVSNRSQYSCRRPEDRGLVRSLVQIHARSSKIEKDQLELMNELNNTLDRFFNSTSKEVKGAINQTTLNESCEIILYILNYLRYTIGLSAKSSGTEKYLNIIEKIDGKFKKMCRSSICLDAQLTSERILTIDSYCRHLRIKVQSPEQVIKSADFQTDLRTKQPESVLVLIDSLLASHRGTFDPPLPEVVLDKIKESVYEFFDSLGRTTWVQDGQSIHPSIANLDVTTLDLIFNLMSERRILLQRAVAVSYLIHYSGHLLFFDTIIAIGERILMISLSNLYNTNIRIKISYINSLKVKMVNKFKSQNPGKLSGMKYISIYERLAKLSSTEQLLSEAPDKLCAICLKDDISLTNFSFLDKCCHIFCSPCILKWVKSRPQNICPTCRAPVKHIFRKKDFEENIDKWKHLYLRVKFQQVAESAKVLFFDHVK